MVSFLLLTLFSSITAEPPSDMPLLLRLFLKEDTDNDGILSTSQFIDGLLSAFVNLGIENNKDHLNNFGREFVGKKRQKCAISIHSIESWLETEELQNSFLQWRHITDEGDAHHHHNHKHIPIRRGFNVQVQNNP